MITVENIAIPLIDTQKGKEKTQACANALLASIELPYNTCMENQCMDDPVAMYMHELSAIEPLTKDEETTLFEEELRESIGKEQHESIERRLIESQLPLVASIAQKHIASGLPMLELIQEGNLGLMQSVRSFAEKPTGDFPTFAATYIEDVIAQAYRK